MPGNYFENLEFSITLVTFSVGAGMDWDRNIIAATSSVSRVMSKMLRIVLLGDFMLCFLGYRVNYRILPNFA
jgi:hypothetical protein